MTHPRLALWHKATREGRPEAERNLLLTLTDEFIKLAQKVSDLEVRVNEILQKVFIHG